MKIEIERPNCVEKKCSPELEERMALYEKWENLGSTRVLHTHDLIVFHALLSSLVTYQCDHPKACGRGAICNSCAARKQAQDLLEKLIPFLEGAEAIPKDQP